MFFVHNLDPAFSITNGVYQLSSCYLQMKEQEASQTSELNHSLWLILITIYCLECASAFFNGGDLVDSCRDTLSTCPVTMKMPSWCRDESRFNSRGLYRSSSKSVTLKMKTSSCTSPIQPHKVRIRTYSHCLQLFFSSLILFTFQRMFRQRTPQ